MPGAVTRFGPANANGLARSDQTGSVRMLRPGDLDQQRGVADHGDAQTRRRARRLGRHDRHRRPAMCARAAAELPAQQVAEAAIGRRLAGIEEAGAVEMVAGRALDSSGCAASAALAGFPVWREGWRRCRPLVHDRCKAARVISCEQINANDMHPIDSHRLALSRAHGMDAADERAALPSPVVCCGPTGLHPRHDPGRTSPRSRAFRSPRCRAHSRAAS